MSESVQVNARQVSGPDLSGFACPSCARVGTLTLEDRLVALPMGTWSLAGVQDKVSAVMVAHIVCSAEGCGFVKAPKRDER